MVVVDLLEHWIIIQFFTKNILKRLTNHLPMGMDKMALTFTKGSSYFQTYSLSFSEPWFGGKKPQTSQHLYHIVNNYLYNYRTRDVTRSQSFNITSLSVGYSKKD